VAQLADLMERLAADLQTLPTTEGDASRARVAGARR
jgi:hypothetical protein